MTFRYAGDVGRTFEANLNDTSREYLAKVQAFFKYAESDDHMVSHRYLFQAYRFDVHPPVREW